ncbi:hypothetical protein ISCGN_027071 [Ixodes scapularis]
MLYTSAVVCCFWVQVCLDVDSDMPRFMAVVASCCVVWFCVCNKERSKSFISYLFSWSSPLASARSGPALKEIARRKVRRIYRLAVGRAGGGTSTFRRTVPSQSSSSLASPVLCPAPPWPRSPRLVLVVKAISRAVGVDRAPYEYRHYAPRSSRGRRHVGAQCGAGALGDSSPSIALDSVISRTVWTFVEGGRPVSCDFRYSFGKLATMVLSLIQRRASSMALGLENLGRHRFPFTTPTSHKYATPCRRSKPTKIAYER